MIRGLFKPMICGHLNLMLTPLSMSGQRLYQVIGEDAHGSVFADPRELARLR